MASSFLPLGDQPQAAVIDPPTVDSIINCLPISPAPDDLPADTTPADIVNWLLRTLGSFLTTIIMYFLHRWFPRWFPTSKIRAYKSPPSPNPRDEYK